MEILRDISMLWSMVHTLILFLFLFEPRYPKKKAMWITMMTMIPLIIINLVLFIVVGFERYGTLMLLTLSLPSCIVFWLLAKHRDGRFFFTFCMVDTIVLEIVYITNILNHYLTPERYLVMFLVRLVSYPLIEVWLYRKMRPIYFDLQKFTKDGWGIFAVIGLLFYVAITLLMTYPDSIVHRPEQLPALILLFILMPVIYNHIILTLRRQQLAHERSQQESIMHLQVTNVMSRMEELNAANERFREERHNFRHKLKAIASLAETGQYEALLEIVREYEKDIERTRVVRYSKSTIIDAVLSVYIQKAEKAGIALKLGFAFPDTFEVNESELATALANAIENAIHACEKLPKEKRLLEIKVLCKPKFIIMVRNNFTGTVTFDENGIPQNTQDGHGYGSRSIAAFCNKIGGYYEFKAENGVFTLFMHLK